MGVVALRKCIRTSKHRRKQGSRHKQTHRAFPLFSVNNVRRAKSFKCRFPALSGLMGCKCPLSNVGENGYSFGENLAGR
jgi:hypothetical protein